MAQEPELVQQEAIMPEAVSDTTLGIKETSQKMATQTHPNMQDNLQEPAADGVMASSKNMVEVEEGSTDKTQAGWWRRRRRRWWGSWTERSQKNAARERSNKERANKNE